MYNERTWSDRKNYSYAMLLDKAPATILFIIYTMAFIVEAITRTAWEIISRIEKDTDL